MSQPVRTIPSFDSRYIKTNLSLLRTARLPVIYVLTKRAIDVAHAASTLASTSRESLDGSKAVLLTYDVGFAHQAGTPLHHLTSLEPSPS